MTARTAALPATCRDWQQVHNWVYQLSGYQDARLDQIAASDFQLAVIDLARDGSTDYFGTSELDAVKNRGKIVLAYFEIGAIEDYRPEWGGVPEDLKLGRVQGWPGDQYVKYWDERWWPIVKGRIDRAIAAGFDGACLDMIVTYREIPADAAGSNREDLARKMVQLIARVSAYAKTQMPDFKIVPQNAPELYTWSSWGGAPNMTYWNAVDGLGMEELYYLATDEFCSTSGCQVNRDDAAALRGAGKLVLTIDYANQPANIADAYTRSTSAGFVPYTSSQWLNVMKINPSYKPDACSFP